PQISVIDQEISTVNVAIVIQNKVFYDGPNPMGIDTYPFIPVFGYFNPSLIFFDKRIQGVLRGLRDAQYLYNRRKIIELDIMESQINSGWKFKENALVNPKDIFLTGQGRGLAIKEDAMMSDVEQIIPPSVPASMMQLSESLGQEIQQISGVNEELIGSAMDDKAGILSMLRQGAGLTTLQGLFDNLDYSQKLLGKVILELLQTTFTPGKVKRILNEEPSPQFYHKAFGRYDAAVEEGLNTTTQKQMYFAQLLQLKEAGMPIPDEAIIDAATVQNKDKLLQQMEQIKQQAAQAQQMQLQATVEEQQARTELAKARATADQGLGLERMSRIKENQALAEERKAEASKDRASGILDLITAAQKIEGIDIEHVRQIIEIIKNIEQKGDNINEDVEQRQKEI
ncbi:MAG: hypothetical protein PHS34_09375, partial [Candidatus Omnitrophica bacterium]|nr:hypothetical protein [Candidatus Omnitrophota bacterium]